MGAPENVSLHELGPESSEFMEEVLTGLQAERKSIPCKYLYDKRGSELFDQICELDEYYPTRTELAIMEAHGADMGAHLGPRCLLIEFGSGSSLKTRTLIEQLDDPAGYVPIDISREHLAEAAELLNREYPSLEVLPVWADYTSPIELPTASRKERRRIVYFPGSTIGNFSRAEAVKFLTRMAALCGAEGGVLIGVDLEKDPAILERAYDDSEGVTAAFNLNLLDRMNAELDTDFDVDRFRHRALYNGELARVEMHLESMEEQEVRVDGSTFRFRKGETIHTESSHKYSVMRFSRVAEEAGLAVEHVWTDADELFSVQLLKVKAP